MFDLSHVNLWAVLVAAIVDMAIGFVWYQKAVFGGEWAKLVGKEMGGQGANPAIYLVNLVVYLVLSYVLAQVIFYFGATSLWAGAQVGIFVWVGFVMTTTIIENLFAGRPWKLWAINYLYSLVAITVMSAILAVWR